MVLPPAHQNTILCASALLGLNLVKFLDSPSSEGLSEVVVIMDVLHEDKHTQPQSRINPRDFLVEFTLTAILPVGFIITSA